MYRLSTIVPPERNLLRVRIILFVASLCSPLFYYFMTEIDHGNDWVIGRSLILVIGLAGFLLTFSKKPFEFARLSINLTMSAYMLMYGYLLYVNDWSVFYRWAYFVVISIVVTAVLTWKDYILMMIIGILTPVLFMQSGKMSNLEIFHFYSALFVAFLVIGLTLRSNFRYQDEVSNLTQTLIENSKLSALGEMAASISHEINNPLTILKLSGIRIQSILGNDEDKVSSTLLKMNEAVERISKVVSGLRQYAQTDSSEKVQIVDVQKIFDDIKVIFLEKLKSEQILLDVSYSSEQTLIVGHQSAISHILLNLMNNAIDDAKRAPLNRKISVSFSSTDSEVSVLVQDNGPGVPKELELKVFDPFFTTKEVGEGMGLGLSTSKGMARAHQGDLIFDRSISASCFVLKFPKLTQAV